MGAKHATETIDKPKNQQQRFVDAVLQRCQIDKGLAAQLRRADNPATEYQSWDFLARLGVDLDREYKRLPYLIVAAAIAKSKTTKNGKLGLGRAIALCYEKKGNKDEQAIARLRRLLACDDLKELCRLLRPLFALISSRVTQPLDFVTILEDLCWFQHSPQQKKAHWAQDFYRSDGNKVGSE